MLKVSYGATFSRWLRGSPFPVCLFVCQELFVGAFAKLLKRLLASSCLSVRPHGTIRLPQDGFPCNVMFECFSKMCRENSSFVKIRQEWLVLYKKTNIHFRSYIAQFFLEWEMFQTIGIEEIKIRFLSNNHFSENLAIYEIMRKYTGEPNTSLMKLRRMRIACWIPKASNTRSEYVIFIAFPLQQCLHEQASILRYAYFACPV